MKSNKIYNWPETEPIKIKPSLSRTSLGVEYSSYNIVGVPYHQLRAHFLRLPPVFKEELVVAPPMGKGSVPFNEDEDTFFD